MIFPIGDTQVKGGYKPYFAYSFIALNIIMFIIQMSTPGNLVCELSVIPQNIKEGKDYFTLLSSIFLHGGFMHIIGNMLFLWVFADNIEAVVGNFKFVVFYLLGGFLASFAHILMDGGNGDLSNCCNPCLNCTTEGAKACAGLIPSLGASGAISAVMGAYMVMFPKSQIKILVIFLFRHFHINAWIFLGLWFGQQLLSGFGSSVIAVESIASSGVAWWAHIGGFVFGIIAGFYFKQFVGKTPTIDTDDNKQYV
jgi:membrane associated rhomboid family serine protease